MYRNLKNRQSMMIGFLIAFMMISVGFFTGCTNKNQSNYVLLTGTQHEILDSVNSEYATLLTNLSAEDARTELVNQLNSNYEEVESAELGEDNYTIFIDFSNGRSVAFDTFDSTEYNDSAILFENDNNASGQGFSQYDNYKLFFDGETQAPPVQDQRLHSFSPLSLSEDTDPELPWEKTTCGSKKVLMLCPCIPLNDTHEQCKAYFKNHGWTDEDITIKENWRLLKPEDFVHLDDYGFILIFAHGYSKNFLDETKSWLQCGLVDNKTIQENALYHQWIEEKKLLIVDTYPREIKEGTNNTTQQWSYDIAIRADALRQNMGDLPGSYVHLASCNGMNFKDAYLLNGAKVFFGWYRSVYDTYADPNQVNIIRCMLEKNYSAYSSYIDDNTVLLAPLTVKYFSEFRLYPLPDASSITKTFYFPAWIDTLNITNIPDDADSVNVTLSNGEVIHLKSKGYHVSSSTLTVIDLDDLVFYANATLTIQVKAFDNSGEELADGKSNFTLTAGANLKQINLTEKESKEERKYVEYSFYGHTNVSIDFSVSSNTWKTGKEVTATATCTNSQKGGVHQFKFSFHNCNVTILDYNPPFPFNSSTGMTYGSIHNGSLGVIPEIQWSSNSAEGNAYGSPATFTVRFRLNSRSAGYISYIQAHCWPIEHDVYSCPQIIFI
jgi:hypothetical protein